MSEPLRLRPLTVLEIVDGAFLLYRRNFGRFLGVFSLIYLPFAAVAIALAGAFSRFYPWPAIVAVENLVLMFVASPLARAPLIRAIADGYLGIPGSVGRSFAAFRRVWASYLAAIVAVVAFFVVGSGLCVVPGLVVLVWFFAAGEACVLERLGPVAALKRSVRLARRHEMRVVGMGLLLVLLHITFLLSFSFGCDKLLPYATDDVILQSLLQEGLRHLITAVLVPFFSVAWVLLYYDIRIREEGFDLEVLAVGPDAGARP